MAAFYLTMTGNADYQPSPGYEDKWHVIGPGNKPVWTGKKRDVPKLFTPAFHAAYRAWELYHFGLSTPEHGTWLQEAVALLESQYRARFSAERKILDSLSVIRSLLGERRR